MQEDSEEAEENEAEDEEGPGGEADDTKPCEFAAAPSVCRPRRQPLFAASCRASPCSAAKEEVWRWKEPFFTMELMVIGV